MLDEVARVARLHKLSTATSLQIARFVDSHLHPMCAADRRRSIDDPTIGEYVNIFTTLDCGAAGNPLRAGRWLGGFLDTTDGALGSYGYTKVRIRNRPNRPKCSYLFARDKDGQDYFIRIGNTGLTQRQFDELKVGDVMSVWPEDKCGAGKARAVRDAVPW